MPVERRYPGVYLEELAGPHRIDGVSTSIRSDRSRVPPLWAIALGIGAGFAAVTLARHLHRASAGHVVPGGVVMQQSGVYDVLTGIALGSFFDGIAADAERIVPPASRVLEIGCGPGHLAARLSRRGLDVIGLDLDPAMIERARANASRAANAAARWAFVVGDVASLPFADGHFDLVVSSLSMHHWADKTAGLAEIARVLKPDGRAIIWDFRPGMRPHPFAPPHDGRPDPFADLHGTGLSLVAVAPWHWPWRLALTQRIELARAQR